MFVKQKTAYEMRISDWSSDVCSSDLTACCRSSVAPLTTDTDCGTSISACSRFCAVTTISPSDVSCACAGRPAAKAARLAAIPRPCLLFFPLPMSAQTAGAETLPGSHPACETSGKLWLWESVGQDV